MTITGRVTSVQIFENRSNIYIIHVLHDEYSGSFNADMQDTTLDDRSAICASRLAEFVESRHVRAVLTGVDDSTGGTGARKCEKIELQTILE